LKQRPYLFSFLRLISIPFMVLIELAGSDRPWRMMAGICENKGTI